MASNPPQQVPGAPFSPAWYARFQRWYWSHVLHVPRPSKRKRIVAHAKGSLRYHGRMHYTETVARSELFHRPRGKFLGAHADCSQYSATLCHWVGVPTVTDTDWTGTLAKKGKPVEQPSPGVFVFFGAPPYVHMAVMVSKTQAIGFGQQAAPNQSSLAGLVAYFAGIGHPGHAFRDLTAT
jgi:hypothetical protein